MRQGQWLIIGIVAVLAHSILRWHQWWCILPLLWFSWVAYCQLSRRYFQIMCVVLLLVFGVAMIQRYDAYQQQPESISRAMTLTVHPDDLNSRDHRVTGRVRYCHRNYYLIWQIDDQAVYQQYQKMKSSFKLQGIGQINEPQRKNNRHSMDFYQMLAYRNIQYVIRLRSGVITNSQPKLSLRDWILSGIKDWHFGLVSWFECLPDGLRDYGETLLLGFTRPDFYDDNRGIRTAGLVHLFSISGFQVMLVYRSWRAFGRWVGIARETNLMMLQIGLVGLWLFAGGVISLIRPISLAILNTWREMHWLKLSRYDLFGWSLLFGVVIEPGVLQTLGGQLSYVLAFGLLWVDDRPDWQVSLLLGVMIVPYLIYHTYEWHPLALLVNLVAVPVFTWVILPVLVIGILAAKFNMILIVTIANQLIQWCQFLIANVGQVPGNLNFGAISLLSAGILVFLTVRLLEMVNRVRIFQIIGYLILLTCLAGRTFCGRVIFINVGQGDSTLFVMPFKRQIMLLDTGGTRMMPDSNNIKRLRYQSKSAQDLLRNLSGFGISRIDQLVLTHKDWDHIGNLGALAKAMPINEVIVPSGMEHDNNFRRMTRPLKLNIRAITDQDQKVSQLKIIHPLTQGTGENEHSLAGIGQFGPLKMVFTGDLDQAGEERILQNYDVPQIDVLKFGHHGSQTSTSDKWLSQLRPRIGIVSAGQNNRYRHPSQIVLQKARDRKMLVYNTQKHGMVEYTWFFGTSWWRTLYNGSDITDNSK